MMRLSDQGLEHVKAHEGLRLAAYRDPGSRDGLPITIGYGSTRRLDGSRWQLGDRIDQAQADALLRRDIGHAEATVNRLVRVPLAQCQFDALVSLVYNIGAAAFEHSTLLRHLNRHQYDAAAGEFGRWCNAGGKPLEGLIKRRAAEAAMFAQAAAGAISGAGGALVSTDPGKRDSGRSGGPVPPDSEPLQVVQVDPDELMPSKHQESEPSSNHGAASIEESRPVWERGRGWLPRA